MSRTLRAMFSRWSASDNGPRIRTPAADRSTQAFEYVGGSVQPFETCVDDIDAALHFLRRDVDAVVLNGHSLGCDIVVLYMLSGSREKELVKALSLMSPCDIYAFKQLSNKLGGSKSERRTGPTSS